MLLFMQIARAAVDAARKIISSVSFCPGPSLDTENTLLAFRQRKDVHRGIAIPFRPFTFLPLLLFFASPFRELSNFLHTPFEGSSSNAIRTVCLILSSSGCSGWKRSVGFFLWPFKEALLAAAVS